MIYPSDGDHHRRNGPGRPRTRAEAVDGSEPVLVDVLAKELADRLPGRRLIREWRKVDGDMIHPSPNLARFRVEVRNIAGDMRHVEPKHAHSPR